MQGSPVKLIVGLGNPGDQYTKTRHNAGFLFVDRFARQHAIPLKADKNCLSVCAKTQLGDQDLRLLKPQTFMNLSGQAVVAACRYYKCQLTEVLVVHDDIDLEPGVARLKLEGGHGGNNGLRDIIQKTGARDFARLRIGVGHPGVGRDVASYVLKSPNTADCKRIELAIDESLTIIPDLVQGDFARAMNHLHTLLK